MIGGGVTRRISTGMGGDIGRGDWGFSLIRRHDDLLKW
jgi:hypothetical protein